MNSNHLCMPSVTVLLDFWRKEGSSNVMPENSYLALEPDDDDAMVQL